MVFRADAYKTYPVDITGEKCSRKNGFFPIMQASYKSQCVSYGIIICQDLEIERINARKEIFQNIINRTFDERAKNFDRLFAALDKGIGEKTTRP